jgi:hypothetical protein
MMSNGDRLRENAHVPPPVFLWEVYPVKELFNVHNFPSGTETKSSNSMLAKHKFFFWKLLEFDGSIFTESGLWG